ncbi:MAG: DNA polymerase III subunit delta [Terriglobales bacterium]
MAESPSQRPLRPAYLLAGAEAFFRDRFLRQLRLRVPPELWEYTYHQADLASTPWAEVLNGARTPSLLAPLQIFVLDNAEHLASRGAGAEGLAAFVAAATTPPAAVLVFVARRIVIPADARQMALEDKARLEKLEALLGAACEVIRCAQVEVAEGAQFLLAEAAERGVPLPPAAARDLLECSGGDLARALRELEKLALYAPGQAITADTVRALVPEAPVLSSEGLVRALARGSRAEALAQLDAVWAAEGEAAAIPLIFQLSRMIKMALVARAARVRDRQRLYQVLPVGLRPPSFAADAVLALAQGLSSSQLRAALDRLQRADVALRSRPLSPRLVIEGVLIQWLSKDLPVAG